jgi:hypothetical protein
MNPLKPTRGTETVVVCDVSRQTSCAATLGQWRQPSSLQMG